MNRLKRNPTKGYIGGVCEGFGEHTGLDPIIFRAATIFIPGGAFVYVFFWIFLEKK